MSIDIELYNGNIIIIIYMGLDMMIILFFLFFIIFFDY